MESSVFNGAQASYLVHPQSQAVLDSSSLDPYQLKPVLVLSSNNGDVDADVVSETVQKFAAMDDVFSADFLSDRLIVQAQSGVKPRGLGAMVVSTPYGRWTFETVVTSHDTAESPIVPNGPYFLRGKSLHQAWRLYPDKLDCFTTAIVQRDVHAEDSIFDPLLHLHSEGVWKNVAVPSRLYAKPSLEKPLAGQRISVKDCYRILGVKTTMSSRPFVETYGPDNETAAFVNELIGLGAVVVGKSKMSAFLSAQEPTDQWIDFHAPFNPRGDGYQTPAGSSNGAAAALAGYPWLDYSIGTDTSGSIRYPAALCGLHALRYTSQTISMAGVWPSCLELDAIGLLARDLEAAHRFIKATVKAGPSGIQEFPKRILYPTDFLPYEDSKMQAIVDAFLKHMENCLGVKKSVISIAERWSECSPAQSNGRSIGEFLEKVGYYQFYYDGYNEYEQFRRDYREKFDKEPYVGPYMQWKWETGSKVTAEQKAGAIQDMMAYRSWFSDCIMGEDAKSASDAILIMPLDTPAPDYRDTIHKPPGPVTAFSESYTASLLGLPQLVVTIGQVPYESRATKRTEYHPVTISLVGARGSDLMLVNLAQKVFEEANWSDQLLTGRYTFNVGAGVRYVAEDEAPGLCEKIVQTGHFLGPANQILDLMHFYGFF